MRPDAPARTALLLWGLTRLALLVLTSAGAWTLSGVAAADVRPFAERWENWDVDLFRKVAEFGYDGYPQDYPDVGIEGFFPGYPLLLRLAHLVVPDWTLAGMAVSLLAGAVAVVGLARLAVHEGAPPDRAVLYLLVSPWAVFLAAAYSESLFLALALWGWLAARQGAWARASVLVALACTVRVSGLFLAVALVVELGVQRRWRDAPWLLLPFAALGAYAAYLHRLTGDPLRWLSAQEEGWGRRLTAPWESLRTTLAMAADPAQRADFAWAFSAEVACVAVGVLVTGVLLLRRRWAEAVYLGLSVGALATSTYYLSVNRATLLWFPVWLLLAAASARWRWVHPLYLAVAAPLSAVLALTFTRGLWIG